MSVEYARAIRENDEFLRKSLKEAFDADSTYSTMQKTVSPSEFNRILNGLILAVHDKLGVEVGGRSASIRPFAEEFLLSQGFEIVDGV
jgi:hypothetical protein